MNSETARSSRHRRPSVSDPSVLAALTIDDRRQVVFADLRHRWERIVRGERART